jgi:hypothetical protein
VCRQTDIQTDRDVAKLYAKHQSAIKYYVSFLPSLKRKRRKKVRERERKRERERERKREKEGERE